MTIASADRSFPTSTPSSAPRPRRAVARAIAAAVTALSTLTTVTPAGAAVGSVAEDAPILAAPRTAVVDAETEVAKLLDELGLPWGTVVNSWDVTEAAKVLGVEVPMPKVFVGAARRFGLDPMELWRGTYVRLAAPALLEAHRGRLAEVFLGLGQNYGASIDDSDIQQLAARLRLPIGERVDPADVTALLDLGRQRAGLATEVFATVAGVELHLPSTRVAGIGFHEAPTSGERRLPMHVVEKRAFVMPSRGRRTPATSAVDVALPVGVDVLSPVTGVVIDAVNYRLYGKYQDAYITIRPDSAPHTAVRVLHVNPPRVRPGQRVQAGVTVLADGARVFPFESQIEGSIGRHPHVDITVRPR